MKKRSLVSLISATAVSVSSLLALAIVPASAATTLYQWTGAASATAGQNGCASNCWSVAGNWESSTDGGTTWTNPAVAAPSNGVDLQFDNTGLAASATLNDDIASLSVGNVTFKNTATSNGYTVNTSGTVALTVTNSVGASTTNNFPTVLLNVPVTFSGATTIGNTTANNTDVVLGGAVTVASGTLTANVGYNSLGSSLTVASGATLVVNSGGNTSNEFGMLAGSGSIVVPTPTGQNTTAPNTLSLNDASASNTFSGTFDIQSGAQLQIASPTDLGTASLTIESGGQLYLFDSPTKATSSDSLTISNAITMGGNAAGVFNQSQGAIFAGLYDGNKKVIGGTLSLTLSGAVSLTSDTSLASIYDTTTTYNFTNLNKNGHNLTAVALSQPTYGTTILEVNGVQLTNTAAPKTPNTGFALVSAKATPVLGTTLAVTGALVVAARRLKPASKRR